MNDEVRSPMWTLAVCVVGVICSYVSYHLLFERLITRGENVSEIGALVSRLSDSLHSDWVFLGLILMSNILNVAFAYGGLRAKGKRPEKVPIHAAGRISIWYVCCIHRRKIRSLLTCATVL